MSIICKVAIFLPPLMALSATAGSVEREAVRDRSELSLQIYWPEYGNLNQKDPVRNLPVSQNPLASFQVVIQNISNEDQDVYIAGNSWGDSALSFDVKTADGAMKTFSGFGKAYFSNIPLSAHLAPGDFYVRPVELIELEGTDILPDGSHKIFYRNVNFQGMSELLKSQIGPLVTVKVRAHLTQEEDKESSNKVWHGSVVSPWTVIRWTKGASK